MLNILILCLLAGESMPFNFGKSTPEQRPKLIQAAIHENGGTPIFKDGILHFFYQAKPGEHPRIDGDFNFWSQLQSIQGLKMTDLGHGWFHYGVAIKPGSRIEYAFRLGTTPLNDPLNPETVQGWAYPVSVVTLPGYPEQPEQEPNPDTPKGTLTQFSFRSNIRRNVRDIAVYTPPNYDQTTTNYPVLYFKDGNTCLERGQVPQVLDHLIDQHIIPPVIAVFIEPVDRWMEYKMSTLYRMMFLEELLPYLQERWRLDDTRQILIGGSRGGLAALDLTLTYPDRFQGCLAFAPAVNKTDFTTQIQRMEVNRKPRFSIFLGTYDFWRDGGFNMSEVMREKGYRIQVKEVPTGHSIHAWAGYFDELLPALLHP